MKELNKELAAAVEKAKGLEANIITLKADKDQLEGILTLACEVTMIGKFKGELENLRKDYEKVKMKARRKDKSKKL